MKTLKPAIWRWLALILAAFILALIAFRGIAAQPGLGGKPGLDMMSVNLYVGADIGRVMMLDPSAPDYLQQMVGTVTSIYYQMLASAPQIRVRAVAGEIAARRPDVIAVQEASLFRVQSPGDLAIGGLEPAEDVAFDYLEMLVLELKARGLDYKVASSINEVDVELPMLNMQTGILDDIRLTDREAILVRADLPPGQLRAGNQQNGHYQNVILIPSIQLAVERGWCSVDMSVRGRNVRVICTHIEEETAPQLQALQIQELLAGPANFASPVIVSGDFNTDSLHRDGSFAYDLMASSGFSDAWAKTHSNDLAGGLTWGHDDFLADPSTSFDRRIDFAFYRGKGLIPAKVETIDMATGLAQPPLWGSDHAAVAARFMLR